MAVLLVTKRCPTCSRTLPEASYWRDASRPDGLQRTCIECRTPANRANATAWYRRNRARHNALTAARRQARKVNP